MALHIDNTRGLIMKTKKIELLMKKAEVSIKEVEALVFLANTRLEVLKNDRELIEELANTYFPYYEERTRFIKKVCAKKGISGFEREFSLLLGNNHYDQCPEQLEVETLINSLIILSLAPPGIMEKLSAYARSCNGHVKMYALREALYKKAGLPMPPRMVRQ